MTSEPPDPDVSDSERRVHHRVPLDGPVQIEFDQALIDSRGLNLSLGGLLVRAHGPVEVGQTVRVSVAPPGGATIQTEAEVVRAEGGLIGLRFLRFDQPNLRALLSQLDRA